MSINVVLILRNNSFSPMQERITGLLGERARQIWNKRGEGLERERSVRKAYE